MTSNVAQSDTLRHSCVKTIDGANKNDHRNYCKTRVQCAVCVCVFVFGTLHGPPVMGGIVLRQQS